MNSIAKLCLNYLKEEGYAPKLTERNDVVFKAEGKTFIVSTDDNDEQFLRLLLPNFYEIESDTEMNKAFRVANKINRSVKVGKVMIMDDNHVWAFAEQFIDSSPDLDDFFNRTIKVVRKAADDFASEMLSDVDGLLRKLLR